MIIIIIVVKKNECNCKTQNNCLLNVSCNLNNEVYQGIIDRKENKKLISEFLPRNGKLDTRNLNFLSPMKI